MSQTSRLNERLSPSPGNGGAGTPSPAPAEPAAPVAAPKQTGGGATKKLIEKMAAARCLDPGKFLDVIIKTVMPEGATMEHVAALLLVADKYGLDPLVKEVAAFKTKGGGVAISVPIDGWCKIVNRRPECDGWDFEDKLDADGNMISCTVRFYRKDRSHPSCVTEYMDECRGQTHSQSGALMPWGKWPKRCLRHKTFSQGVRYTFGISDIIDPDEVERYKAVGEIVAGPVAQPLAAGELIEASPALPASTGAVAMPTLDISQFQIAPAVVGVDPSVPGADKTVEAVVEKEPPDPTWAERHGQPKSFSEPAEKPTRKGQRKLVD